MRHVARREYGRVPFTRYDEAPGHPMHPHRFEDDVYTKIVDSLVIDCTDTVVINGDRPDAIWLTQRQAKPMVGWWIIGGRRKPPMKIEDAMSETFKRETTLSLPPDRFHFLRVNEYTWKDRQQEPQDGGSHNTAATFVVALSAEELAQASANLEKKEYAKGTGLTPFNREELERLYEMDQMHPMLIDLWHQVFPAIWS